MVSGHSSSVMHVNIDVIVERKLSNDCLPKRGLPTLSEQNIFLNVDSYLVKVDA